MLSATPYHVIALSRPDAARRRGLVVFLRTTMGGGGCLRLGRHRIP